MLITTVVHIDWLLQYIFTALLLVKKRTPPSSGLTDGARIYASPRRTAGCRAINNYNIDIVAAHNSR